MSSLSYRFIDDTNSWLRGTQNSADNRSARCVVLLQDLPHAVQTMRSDAQQQAAAGLRVGEENFLSDARAPKIGERFGGAEIFPAATGDAILRDQIKNFFPDHGQSSGANLRAHVTGAAQRTEVTQ